MKIIVDKELILEIAHDAHTMGRVYTFGGEELKPALEFERVEKMIDKKLRRQKMGNCFMYQKAVVSKKRSDGKRSYDVGIGVYNHNQASVKMKIIFQRKGEIVFTKDLTIGGKREFASMLPTLGLPEPEEQDSYQIFIPKIQGLYPIAYQFQTDENRNRRMETMKLMEEDLTLGES